MNKPTHLPVLDNCNGLPLSTNSIYDAKDYQKSALILWETKKNKKKNKKKKKKTKIIPNYSSLSIDLLNKIGDHFFFEELQIPKDKLEHFIEFCSYNKVEQLYNDESILDLIVLLKNKSNLYNRH